MTLWVPKKLEEEYPGDKLLEAYLLFFVFAVFFFFFHWRKFFAHGFRVKLHIFLHLYWVWAKHHEHLFAFHFWIGFDDRGYQGRGKSANAGSGKFVLADLAAWLL